MPCVGVRAVRRVLRVSVCRLSENRQGVMLRVMAKARAVAAAAAAAAVVVAVVVIVVVVIVVVVVVVVAAAADGFVAAVVVGQEDFVDTLVQGIQELSGPCTKVGKLRGVVRGRNQKTVCSRHKMCRDQEGTVRKLVGLAPELAIRNARHDHGGGN